MAEVAERSTVEQLKAARERIAPVEAWTTQTYARDDSKFLCAIDAPTACQWCVEGSLAVELLTDGAEGGLVRHSILMETDAYQFLIAAARECGDERPEPAEVNDRRGHGATLAMCDRAIQLAEQEATNV